MYLQAEEDCSARGLPTPDIASVREKCLGNGVAAFDVKIVKDFLRFYIASSKGHLGDRPTVDSVNTHAEWLFAGFSRATGTPTDKAERTEVHNWVRRTLTRDGLIVNKRRPKHLFDKEDLDAVLLILWTKDDLIFIHERNRVQFTFIFHVYCWTGARLSAFFTGGLRYKDIELAMRRRSGGGWTLIYKIDQRWVKNNRDPEHISFGAASKEHAKLLYNDGALLLPMAILDRALSGFDSMEELWRQEIPPDEVVLPWNESTKGLPILRNITISEGVTEQPMTKEMFLRIFRSTMKNAGNFCGSSIHAIRRYLGRKVDGRYTETERSQHITQSDPRIFGQSYVVNCSSVDGQAAFLGKAAEHNHVAYFQSFRKFRERGLPCRLPAEIEASLKRDSTLLELRSKVRDLKGDNKTNPCEITEAENKVQQHLYKLKTKTLKQYQEDWVRNRRDEKIMTRGKEPPGHVIRTDVLQSLSLIMPERGRLTEKMASDEPLTERKCGRQCKIYMLCAPEILLSCTTQEKHLLMCLSNQVLSLENGKAFYYHLSGIHSLCRSEHEKRHYQKAKDDLRQDKDGESQKRKIPWTVPDKAKRQKVMEEVPQGGFVASSPLETHASPTDLTAKPSPLPSGTAGAFTDTTVSPSLLLLSPVYPADEDDSLNLLDSLEAMIDSEVRANPRGIVDLSAANPPENNSLTYDDWLSQYITIPHSTCPSIVGDEDGNGSLPDLTFGESSLPSETATSPTNTIDTDLVEPDKKAQTRPKKPGIKLRLNPPNPKIILRLKQPEHISSEKRRCRVENNGRQGGSRALRSKKSACCNKSTKVTRRKRST